MVSLAENGDFFIDKCHQRNYNVITMKSTIVAIGNSRGVRIPKPLLEESGLVKDVEIYAKNGEIRIVPAGKSAKKPVTFDAAVKQFVDKYDEALTELAEK